MSLKKFLFFLRRDRSQQGRSPSFWFYPVDVSAVRNTFQLTGLLPVIGYAVAIVSLADLLYVLFPLQLQNPSWELQTLGTLVEQSWVFLIGLGLIFSRYLGDNQKDVRLIEIFILRCIRWLVLFMAILFVLSTPLILSDTVRVYRSINQQMSTADAAQLSQIQQIEAQVDQVSDPEVMLAIGQSIGLDPQTLANSPLSEQKKTIINQLDTAQSNIEKQVRLNQKDQSRQLIKSSARTLYSGIIISFTFILIWSKIGKFTQNFYMNQ